MGEAAVACEPQTGSLDITVDSRELGKAMAVVNKAIASQDHFPALTGVLLQASAGNLSLTSTNLDLAIQVGLPVPGEATGEVLVSGRMLQKLVQRLPAGNVQIQAQNDGVHLVYFGGELSLPHLERDRFPEPVFPGPDTASFSLSGSDLRKLVGQVAFAAGDRNKVRPILTGISLQVVGDGMAAVASDGVRLAYAALNQPAADARKVVLAAEALNEVAALLNDDPVTVVLEDRYVYFRQGSWVAGLRYLEGDYPDFQRLLPVEYPHQYLLNQADLAKSLDRLRLVAERQHPQAKFIFAGPELTLEASSETGVGQEQLQVTHEAGDDLQVVFNSRHFSEILRKMNVPKVRLAMAGPEAPARFSVPEGEGEYFVILLPIRYR